MKVIEEKPFLSYYYYSAVIYSRALWAWLECPEILGGTGQQDTLEFRYEMAREIILCIPSDVSSQEKYLNYWRQTRLVITYEAGYLAVRYNSTCVNILV